MAIKQTSISYYGLNYVEHAEADIAVEEGVDRIAAWTYRGGYGTVVGAPDALKLWDRIGENYRRVLGG